MAAPNFRRFVEGTWRTACFHRCKASTRQRMDSALRTQLLPVFGEQRLNEITASAVHEWFDRYSETAPAGANRVLDILRQIFNYGIECGHLDSNPARGVRHNPRPRVTRFLSQGEVARVHAALDAHRGRGSGQQQAAIIRLLLLTGVGRVSSCSCAGRRSTEACCDWPTARPGHERSVSARPLRR